MLTDKAGPSCSATAPGWATLTLSRCADVNPESLGALTPSSFEFRYVDISSVTQGVIDWQTVTLQRFCTSPSRARRVVRPGDVLLCTVRPRLQAHAFAGWPQRNGYVCSTGFAVLRPRAEVEPRYLFHTVFGPGVADQLRRLETGTNYPAVSESDVGQVTICLPPLPEQRRIAEILDTVDAAIQQTEALIAKLKLMKAGLMHDLLTRGLDENGELRDPVQHPEQFKDTPAGRGPASWDLVPIGDIFDLQLGKMLSKVSKTGRSPYPYLANRNVQWDQVDLSTLEWMDFTPSERAKFALEPGDLLVCEGGEVGRTALWRGEMEGCYFQKAVHRLRRRGDRILPEFALAYMRLAADLGLFRVFTSQTSIAHLTAEKLALVPMPLPRLWEQEAIVRPLGAAARRLAEELACEHKLILLKKGLMDDLLTGRVRVPVQMEESA